MKMMKKFSTIAIAAAMAAAMAVGTAVSASAATVVGSPDGTDGGFYAYWDSDDDGEKEWAAAPYGMYDGNIDGTVTYNSATDSVTFSVKEATYTIEVNGHSYEATGSITDIIDENGTSVLNNGVVTMVVGEEYTLKTSSGGHENGTQVIFVIS